MTEKDFKFLWLNMQNTIICSHLFFIERNSPLFNPHAPGTPEALPVVPDSDLRANSMFLRGNPISMSCRTMGSGGTGDVFCFFCLGGRTCCTVTGVVASLELLSSKSGEDGWADSTARY